MIVWCGNPACSAFEKPVAPYKTTVNGTPIPIISWVCNLCGWKCEEAR